MKIRDILLNLSIILGGPLATLYMILAGKGFKFKTQYFIIVGIGAAIALIVSIVINATISKDLKITVTISIIISEIIYFAVLIVGSLNSPKDLMWLPVALIFLPIYSLPTALSVSYGTSRLIKINKKRNSGE